MHQFYIEDINDINLSKDQLHQLRNVLRMKKDDVIRLVDQKGIGYIAKFKNDELSEFELIEKIQFTENKVKLKLIASLIRNERLEWMIQKASEVGIDEVVLYSADHGVVKSYGKKEARKIERLNTIAFEASEQSYRQFPLVIKGVINKEDINNELSQLNLFADTNKAPFLTDVFNEDIESISICVGPEGGFSEAERDYFFNLGMLPISLGSRIYRAETAPLAIGVLTHSFFREV